MVFGCILCKQYLCVRRSSVAMSESYLCTNILTAVDSYDLLGVPPGPDGSSLTPLQRVMELSMVAQDTIHECYVRTKGSVIPDSAEARQVEMAYVLLQGDGRHGYDIKLLADASAAWLRHTILAKITYCI